MPLLHQVIHIKIKREVVGLNEENNFFKKQVFHQLHHYFLNVYYIFICIINSKVIVSELLKVKMGRQLGHHSVWCLCFLHWSHDYRVQNSIYVIDILERKGKYRLFKPPTHGLETAECTMDLDYFNNLVRNFGVPAVLHSTFLNWIQLNASRAECEMASEALPNERCIRLRLFFLPCFRLL